MATARLIPLLQLQDGRTLTDLGAGSEVAFTLIASPGDCFACGGFLGDWAKEARRNAESVFLVFTREPSWVEKRTILGARLTVAGVLADTDPPWAGAPWELAFHDGELVYSGSVSPNGVTTRVLSELKDHTPVEAIRRLGREN